MRRRFLRFLWWVGTWLVRVLIDRQFKLPDDEKPLLRGTARFETRSFHEDGLLVLTPQRLAYRGSSGGIDLISRRQKTIDILLNEIESVSVDKVKRALLNPFPGDRLRISVASGSVYRFRVDRPDSWVARIVECKRDDSAESA